MTVTGGPDNPVLLRAQFTDTITRWVATFKRSNYNAAESDAFARWRQDWYDEAHRRLGVKTLAVKKKEQT